MTMALSSLIKLLLVLGSVSTGMAANNTAPTHAPTSHTGHAGSSPPTHAPTSHTGHAGSSAPTHAPTSRTNHAGSSAPTHAPTSRTGHSGSSAPTHAPTSASVSNAPTPASKCPMSCKNGGKCRKGTADFSMQPRESNGVPFTFLEETSIEGWFCNCTGDFTGIRCERPYVACPEADNGALLHYCYNGGECLEGLVNATNVTSDQRFCDCSNAIYGGVPYFGKYCEVEGATECASGSGIYCASSGTCKEDFQTKAHPCHCPDTYRGPHCEFLRGQVPECTLTCKNGGECTLGVKDFTNAKYEDFWMTNDGNYQYCECPKGWFGDNCEIPGIKCGNAHCFNGGTCLQTLNEKGHTTYACDCTSGSKGGKAVAGQYCEAEATVTCQNSASDPNGHLFCTNGGTCKANPHEGCNCPTHFYGPRCEYTNKADAKCSLTCQNGGSCRKGNKDTSMINNFGAELAAFNTTHSQLFEHCVCPDGYFGIQCEHKLEICSGGEHVCLHGSKCVAENESGNNVTVDGSNYKCDCDEGFDAVDRYAGKYCQYTSTDICTINGQPGAGKANFAFCVNNGVCKSKVPDNAPHPGCNCQEGYVGAHCEYLQSSGTGQGSTSVSGASSNPTAASTANASNDGAVIGISVTLIVIIFIAGYLVLRALVCGGRSRGGKYGSEVDIAATAEEDAMSDEQRVGGSAMVRQSASGTEGSGVFEEGGEESLDDIQDFKCFGDESTLTPEGEMTNIQIV